MAVAGGSCPHCGAQVEFRAGASASLVCAHCQHVVVRTDRGLATTGRVADVTWGDTGLAPGDQGTFRGRAFQVIGRVVLAHPAGGAWEEYYALVDGKPVWIAEAQGRWTFVEEVVAEVPPITSITPTQHVQLAPYGIFVVTEVNDGTFTSAEGELPFAATPGTVRRFADLSGANGAWATVDYGDGTTAPRVFLGVETVFGELDVRRAGNAPVHAIAMGERTCGKCGAPLPVLAPAITERVACRFCGAISDAREGTVVGEQHRKPVEPPIALGTKGELDGVTWTVLGYMQRSGEIDGETFGWEEYLLYEEKNGYRWLVRDEGTYYIAWPVPAGDIEDTGSVARWRGRTFRLRNANPATVEYVVGEFYWRIEVGERVEARDFQAGAELLSAERAAQEVNWSYARRVKTRVIEAAFRPGGKAPELEFGVPRASDDDAAGGGQGFGRTLAFLAVLFLGLLFFMAILRAPGASDDDGSSGYHGGSRSTGMSGGGFGGK